MPSIIGSSGETGIRIHERAPRDGLQHEPVPVDTGFKLQLVQRLGDAGLARVEVTGFLPPEEAPGLSDAEALAGALVGLRALTPHVSHAVHVAGVRDAAGLARLRRCRGIRMVAVAVATREDGPAGPVEAQLEGLRPVAEGCRQDGLALRATLSPRWTGSGERPGSESLAALVSLCEGLRDLGVAELCLGDASGMASPEEVKAVVDAVAGAVPREALAFHPGHGAEGAWASVAAAYEAGVRLFDAALGGLGGGPVAAGRSGGLSTEALVDFFEGEGVATGVDRERLLAARAWLEGDVLRRRLPGPGAAPAHARGGLRRGTGGGALE